MLHSPARPKGGRRTSVSESAATQLRTTRSATLPSTTSTQFFCRRTTTPTRRRLRTSGIRIRSDERWRSCPGPVPRLLTVSPQLPHELNEAAPDGGSTPACLTTQATNAPPPRMDVHVGGRYRCRPVATRCSPIEDDAALLLLAAILEHAGLDQRIRQDRPQRGVTHRGEKHKIRRSCRPAGFAETAGRRVRQRCNGVGDRAVSARASAQLRSPVSTFHMPPEFWMCALSTSSLPALLVVPRSRSR